MIMLVFVACLDTTPDTCREHNLLFAENITPMRCLIEAQTELAKWAQGHPQWRIANWRCGQANQFGVGI